jgi:hypothetical protein
MLLFRTFACRFSLLREAFVHKLLVSEHLADDLLRLRLQLCPELGHGFFLSRDKAAAMRMFLCQAGTEATIGGTFRSRSLLDSDVPRGRLGLQSPPTEARCAAQTSIKA